MEWQPIETVPRGGWRFVLLWFVPEKNPNAAAPIIGQIVEAQPSEFWTAVPLVMKALSPDVPVVECCIWDGHVYRPMLATHWMPTPEAPTVYPAPGGD